MSVEDRISKFNVYKDGPCYCKKEKIENKEVVIHIPKRIMLEGTDAELNQYLQKERSFWIKKEKKSILNKDISEEKKKRIIEKNETQRNMQEKKVFRRGERREYQKMVGIDRINKTVEINMKAYGIYSEMEGIKKNCHGQLYISDRNAKHVLVQYQGAYVTQERKEELERIKKRRDESMNENAPGGRGLAAFKQAEMIDRRNGILALNLPKEEEAWWINAAEMNVEYISKAVQKNFPNFKLKDYKEDADYEMIFKRFGLDYQYVEKQCLSGYQKKVYYFNGYSCDWYLDSCSVFKDVYAPDLTREQWDCYCFIALQLFLGWSAGDTNARHYVRCFPYPRDVLYLCSLFREVVVKEAECSIVMLPYTFVTFGSTHVAYKEGYINEFTTLGDSGLYTDATDYFAKEGVCEKIDSIRYFPKNIVTMVKAMNMQNVYWKGSFASIAIPLINKIVNKEGCIYVGSMNFQGYKLKQLFFISGVSCVDDYIKAEGKKLSERFKQVMKKVSYDLFYQVTVDKRLPIQILLSEDGT